MASNKDAKPDEQRVVCVGVGLQRGGYKEELLDELARLVLAVGANPVERVLIRAQKYSPGTLVSSSKLSELAQIIEDSEAEIAVFDEELSPGQVRNLEDALGVRVMDRTELILEIFAQRAESREGKLQVELARLNYLLPRLPGKGKQLSRLGGGIGTRGPGETKLEVDRRTIRRRIYTIKDKLERVRKSRFVRRLARRRLPYPQVSLVGYTNSGKSTLLNALAGSDVDVADQLFSTLDTTTRLIHLPEGGAFFLSDTVGFIRKLPHQLVEAFKATLEDVKEADLLLHVADASHPELYEQIDAVENTLSEIGAHGKPTILVLNKSDLLKSAKRVRGLVSGREDAVIVSALKNKGLADLLVRVQGRLFGKYEVYKFSIPLADVRAVELIRRRGKLIHKRYTASEVVIEARVDSSLANELAQYLR